MELVRSESAPWVQSQYQEQLRESALPSKIQALQKTAYEHFLELGIPTTGDEQWHYTNLTPIVSSRFSGAVKPRSPQLFGELVSSRGLPSEALCGRAVFLNGFFVPELSSLPVTSGLSISSLGLSGTNETTDRILERDKAYETESFVALNTALFQDLLCVRVSKGAVISKPLEILSLTVADGSAQSSFPRVLVQVESGGDITVLERHLSVGSNTFSTTVTEFDVEDNALLNHIFIQELGSESSQVSVTKGRVGRDAKFHSQVFQLGGALVRNEIRPVLAGINGECLLNGLTAINGSQHVDNYTIIDHATPNCFSREHYKGIYSDKSSGVFCGTIIVRQQAQKTNAIQSNQSLLLSPNATIDTKPQLKIWADDVKAHHGATVGQLDEDALFYMRARGIPADTAKKMLIEAFVGELIESISGDLLKQHLYELLERKLSAMI